MADNLGFKMALRFVRSRRKAGLTRFISFASTCGIAIGVFAAIIGLSVMNGFEYELENRVLSIIPSAQLNSSLSSFENAAEIERLLLEDKGIVATSQAIEQKAIISANRAFAPLVIAGIDPVRESKVIDIARFINIGLECMDRSRFPELKDGCALPEALSDKGQLSPVLSADSADSASAVSASAVRASAGGASEGSSTGRAAADADAAGVDGAGSQAFDDAAVNEIAQRRAAAAGSEAYGDTLGSGRFLTAMPDADEQRLPRMIIGAGIARKLGVGPGDVVAVVTLDNSDNGADASVSRTLKNPDKHKVLVAGIIHIGGQMDSSVALMNFADLKEMTGLAGPNSIHIKTVDYQQTNTIVFNATNGRIRESAFLVTWMGSQGKLYHDIQMVRQIMYIAMFLVLAVACFNIVSNLLLMVAEKRREIAILLTMGMKPRHIVRTFSIMGMLSGGQGALIGFIPGLLLSLVLTPFTQSFRDWFGFDLLNQDVYFINFIPCQLSVWDAAFVLASSVLMSLAASLYPALRASRVKPAQELNL